jgi:GNAT superfamily N-acetyltransferase
MPDVSGCGSRMAGRLQRVLDMEAVVRLVRRALELWREFGPRATIGLALKKAVSPVARVGSLYLLECDLTAGLPRVKPVPGVVAREAFLEEIHLLDGIENEDEKKRDAIFRFKRGDRWFVGIDAATGKLANFRWVTTAWELVPELERNVVPQPGQAFIYALYTAPEYRRKGIDSFTRQYTYDLLYRTAGIKTVLATIFAENTVSLKAGRKFLRKIGRVWYVSILGRPTRAFWWPNSKMPTLTPVPRSAASGEPELFDKAG